MELKLTQRQPGRRRKHSSDQSADREGKSRILDELVQLTGGIVTTLERRYGTR